MARWLAKVSASTRDKLLVQQHVTADILAFEERGEETFVVSPRFESCDDVQEVLDAATALIANVNVTFEVVDRHFGGVSFDNIVVEQKNGKLNRTIFVPAGALSLVSTMPVLVVGPDGQPSPAPQRSFPERMLALLGQDDRVREVAPLLRARPVSYQNLFIVYETVKGLVSPNHVRSDWQTLVNLGWISEDDSKRLWETLGYYHHGHPRGSPNGPVLALDKAAEMVGDLFRRMVDHLQPM